MLKTESKEDQNMEQKGQIIMSRRRKAEKRDIIPDPKFNDRVLIKDSLILLCMMAKNLLLKKLFIKLLISPQLNSKVKNHIDLFKTALNNVKPGIEVRSRRVGGATYQVPVEVRNDRALALAIRWIVDSSRKRNEKSMTHRLAQ